MSIFGLVSIIVKIVWRIFSISQQRSHFPKTIFRLKFIFRASSFTHDLPHFIVLKWSQFIVKIFFFNFDQITPWLWSSLLLINYGLCVCSHNLEFGVFLLFVKLVWIDLSFFFNVFCWDILISSLSCVVVLRDIMSCHHCFFNRQIRCCVDRLRIFIFLQRLDHPPLKLLLRCWWIFLSWRKVRSFSFSTFIRFSSWRR